MSKRIRKRIDTNARIRKIKWSLFGIMVISAFGAFVFFDYFSLLKDANMIEDYNFALVLNRALAKKANFVIHNDDFDDAMLPAWENGLKQAEDSQKLIDYAVEFLYANRWDRVDFSILNTDGGTLEVSLRREGRGVTNKIIQARKNFINRFIDHGGKITKEKIEGIESRQRLIHVEFLKLGHNDVARSAVYSNGMLVVKDSADLIWDDSEGRFYFPFLRDMNNYTWVSSGENGIESGIKMIGNNHGFGSDEYELAYKKIKAKKETKVVSLPVLSVKMNVPYSLLGATIISLVYVSFFINNMKLLGVGRLLKSDEPWILVDCLEIGVVRNEIYFSYFSFFTVMLLHTAMLLSPFFLASLLVSLGFIAGSLDLASIAGIFLLVVSFPVVYIAQKYLYQIARNLIFHHKV